MRNSALRDRLLTAAEDDWVGVWEIASMAASVGGATASDDVLSSMLHVLKDTQEQGLIAIRHITAEGFKSWGLSADDACRRIANEWRRFPGGPRLGDISCWINLTNKGMESRSSQSRQLF